MSLGLRRCWDLTEAHLVDAIPSRRATGLLIREMSIVARPNTGAPKILIAVARMAKPDCDWIDGSLRIELERVETKTRLAIMEDLGGGVRELVFPRVLMDAPLEEFERSLKLAPRAVEPLQLETADGGKLVLTHQKSSSTREPPTFELAEDCLRRSLPPSVRKSLAPPAMKLAPEPRRIRLRPVTKSGVAPPAPPPAASAPLRPKKPTRPPPRG